MAKGGCEPAVRVPPRFHRGQLNIFNLWKTTTGQGLWPKEDANPLPPSEFHRGSTVVS